MNDFVAMLRRGSAILVCGLGLATATAPARAEQVAYVADILNTDLSAYLVDWKAGNWARVVGYYGASAGAFTDDGTQRVVTLGVPLSYVTYSANIDECSGLQIQQRYEIRQIVFRKIAGSASTGRSQVAEIGAVVDLEGCTPGRLVPFGSLTDSNHPMQHRAFSARPPMTDVVPGFTIAGFAEGPSSDFDPIGRYNALGADVATLETANSLRFQRTGTAVPAVLDGDQWLMLQIPGSQQRGHTRVILDKASGGETWLVAEFRDGLPVLVSSVTMIKPVQGTSFGSVGQSARMWESSFFVGTDFPFFFYLYRDHGGETVNKDLTTGQESRGPLASWRLEGPNIAIDRDAGPYTRERTWAPLARKRGYVFVMEQESYLRPGYPPELRIRPRINAYIDRGAASRP